MPVHQLTWVALTALGSSSLSALGSHGLDILGLNPSTSQLSHMKYLHAALDFRGSALPAAAHPTQASSPVNHYTGDQIFSLTLDWPHSLERSLHETLNTQWDDFFRKSDTLRW